MSVSTIRLEPDSKEYQHSCLKSVMNVTLLRQIITVKPTIAAVDNILDSDRQRPAVTDYILEEPAKYLQGRWEIREKTLVEAI